MRILSALQRRNCSESVSFLGKPTRPQMLSFQEGASKLGDVPAQVHHAKVKEPLDPGRCEGWINEISVPDRKTVDEITSKYRHLFGYC